MNIQTNTQEQITRIESLPVRTQFIIFALFGDYFLDRVEKIWTGDLLHFLSLLDVSESAARSTLSRMTHSGWLKADKNGRRSQYYLTEKGRDLLLRGRSRIFEAPYENWDQQWHMLVFSLPENLRSKRHSLRTQLAWLGFGLLAPGIWISPHNRKDELNDVIEKLDISDRVEIFSSVYQGPSTPNDLVEQCWEISDLAAQYEKFIDLHDEAYQDLLANPDHPPSLEEAFTRRFWLTHSFQSFPLKDPNLPIELLPKDWVGTKARELFDNYHRLLGKSAYQFVSNVLEESN